MNCLLAPLPSSSEKDNSSEQDYIDAEEAKSIAINHAGVDEDGIYDFSCKLDHEHGTLVYEIEFKANKYEYDYEVNAISGKIIKSEKEYD